MATMRMIRPQNTPSGFVRGGNPAAGPDVRGLVGGVTDLADAQHRETVIAERRQQAERDRLQREAEATMRQQQRDEINVGVLRTISDARRSFTERLNQAQQEAVDGAPGFTEGLLKEFDTWERGAVDTVPAEGRAYFQRQAVQLKDTLHAGAFKFETTARHKKIASDFDTSLDDSARVAWSDPAQFPTLLAQHTASARALGVSEELRTSFVNIAKDKLAYAAATGLVERDPNGVLQRLGFQPGKWQPGMPLPNTEQAAAAVQGDPIFSSLPPEKLQGVLHRALSLSASQDAQRQRLTDKAEKDSKDALEELQKFVMSGALVDSNYRDQVLAVTRGMPQEGAARALLDASVQGAAFGAQPLGRQEQIVRALEAQQASAGANPDAVKLLNQARTIHAAQTKAYEDNPWQAATRFARLPATPEAEIPSAESGLQVIDQRLPLIGDVESASGKPESPLQPGEAAAWATHLSALPVPQRAEILGSAGAKLSAPRILALAEQMDKKDRPLALMLMAGADRTTTGRTVAELIGLGQQAIADKRVKRDDAALSGWRSEISTLVRGAIGDAQAEQNAIDMAYYVRAAMDADGSAVPGFDLQASNKQAVRMVLGDILDREGVKTVLPRGMTEDAFKDRVRMLSKPYTLRLQATDGVAYVRGQPVQLNSLSARLPEMPMRRDGAGNYIPVQGGALVTTDKAGTKPLMLEIR